MCDEKQTIHLILGISGGVSAYKVPGLIRLLKKHVIEIKVVVTESALNLVGENTLQTITGHPVFKDKCSFYDINHIRLAEWADIFLVCPATANTIAKIAHGIADNLLTTIALAFDKNCIIVPAMNSVMWRNPATVDNIAILKKRGIRVLPVSEGALASGDEGPGRMISITSIVEYILGVDLPNCFSGKSVLIASGPTEEPIDPVRVITNRSSGRMGAALANAAMCMGADVTVVTGHSMIEFPDCINMEHVSTSTEMADTLVKHFDKCDVCIMAAAVSDFRPRNFSEKKITSSDKDSFSLELVVNQDIALSLAQKKDKQFLACFSLETHDNEKSALKKMEKKKCDMIIHNSVDSSLGLETSKISILYPGEPPIQMDTMSKRECARTILLGIADKLGLYNG